MDHSDRYRLGHYWGLCLGVHKTRSKYKTRHSLDRSLKPLALPPRAAGILNRRSYGCSCTAALSNSPH
jgi:hypothetical protein